MIGVLAQLLAGGLFASVLAIDVLGVDRDEERLALLFRRLEGPDDGWLPVDVRGWRGSGAVGPRGAAADERSRDRGEDSGESLHRISLQPDVGDRATQDTRSQGVA